MVSIPGLRTERLLLRPLRTEDIPALLSYRNDPEVTRFDGVHAMTEGQARNLVERQAAARPGGRRGWLQIGVELPGAGLIGDCGFLLYDDGATAEIGYRLGRQHWGRGYGAEAVGAVLDWAFGTLELHRLVALMDTRNARSIALMERLGFRREAHFLESYREPEGWSDEYLFAILQREWRGRRSACPSSPDRPDSASGATIDRI